MGHHQLCSLFRWDPLDRERASIRPDGLATTTCRAGDFSVCGDRRAFAYRTTLALSFSPPHSRMDSRTPRKWERAALSIGLASTIKPFLLIFPPYLVLRGQLKAAGIILTLNIIGLVIGLLVFGYTSYESWLLCLANMDWTWPFMNASILGIVTRTLSENPMYGVLTNAEHLSTFLWFTFSAILGIMTLYMTTNDTSPVAIDRGFTLLLITALLISPLGWIYYFFLPIGPMTGMVTTWWKNANKKMFFQLPTLLGARNCLFLLMGVGFLIPPEATLLFQPNAFATLTLGSTYFWSAVALVSCLMLDWKLDNPHQLAQFGATGMASRSLEVKQDSLRPSHRLRCEDR